MGELPEAWSPTKPHTLPRYALKRVTTALHIKLSMPKEAMRVFYREPVTAKLLESGASWLKWQFLQLPLKPLITTTL